jgi:hypothetical protein
MNSREAGLVALIVALFVAFGAFTAATPTNVSAAVTDVDCDGVDETVGLTLEDGEAVDCIVQVDNDEAAVRIQPEGESENLVTLTSPDLTDIAPPPTVIVTLLQGLDSDNNPDPVQVLFEYRCVEGIEDSILIEQAGTLPFGFVRFPITCLGVNLTAPDTAENGVVTTLLVRDEDENGPLGIDLLTASSGALSVIQIRLDGIPVNCPVAQSGPRSVEIDTDDCDADEINEDLFVVVGWLPNCPSEPVNVRIGAKRMHSDDLETVKCFPTKPTPTVVTPTTTVPEIKPPSTGDAGLLSPSGKDSTSPFAMAAAVAMALVGVAGLRFMRR